MKIRILFYIGVLCNCCNMPQDGAFCAILTDETKRTGNFFKGPLIAPCQGHHFVEHLMQDIRIAAAVCNCPPGALDRNLATMKRLSRKAAGMGAALICFPELNLTGYAVGDSLRQVALSPDCPAIEEVEKIARDSGLVVLAGMAVWAPDRHCIYAEHRVFWPDGRSSTYRKVHIAPPERGILSPGEAVPIFEARGLRFGIQLCWDVHFPELSTAMALAGVEAIFVPHASPRNTPRAKFASWLRCLPARAFDNAIFVVACNQTGANGAGLTFPGVAVAIEPDGRVLSKRTAMKEGLLIADLGADRMIRVRGHRMRYFLPHRRPLIYKGRCPR
jgi:N-carbamoylputrescine amidase